MRPLAIPTSDEFPNQGSRIESRESRVAFDPFQAEAPYPMRAVGICIAVVVLALSSPLAAQPSKLDFTLLNRTGLVIQELYVSPDESDNWEEDVLGRDVLKHNESVDIVFSRSEKSCDWDFKITDEDGDEIEWDSLDLCAASHVTLLYRNNQPTAIIK
jgi:hypothetical protein